MPKVESCSPVVGKVGLRPLASTTPSASSMKMRAKER